MALADGAYTWVDEDGIVHFSDVPVEGAEVVNLSEYTKDTGARIMHSSPADRSTGDDSATPAPAFRYESISIAVPGAEETLWNIEGTLNVNVRVSPPLKSGHQVRAYFDGEARMVASTSFTINDRAKKVDVFSSFFAPFFEDTLYKINSIRSVMALVAQKIRKIIKITSAVLSNP